MISVLFFFSGLSALIYEVLWARQLGLVFGATTQAAGAVVAAYMLGLALGAVVCGRAADRATNPLRLYAILEIAIGGAGVLVPLAINRLPSLYSPFVGGGEGAGIGVSLFQLGLALPLLLVPTALMGATFPIIVRVVGSGRTASLARLYAANTCGGVAGSLAAGFFLVPWLGLWGTGTLAAVINVSVGAAAWLMSARWRPEALETSPAPQLKRPIAGAPAIPPALAFALLALSGCTTLGSEILWIRVLVIPLFGTSYTFTAIVSAYLAGLALGSALAGRLARAGAPWPMVGWLCGLQALALLIPVVAVGGIDRAFAVIQAWTGDHRSLSMLLHITAVFIVLLPQTVLAGALYPLLLNTVAAPDAGRLGRTVGRGVFVNTIGAIAGTVGIAHWAIPSLGVLPSFAVFATAWIGTAAWLVIRGRRYPWPAASLCGTVAAATLAAVAWGPARAARPNALDGQAGADGSAVRTLAYRESAESTVAVVDQPNGRALRINGFEAAGVRGDLYGYMRLMAHLPLLLHTGPRDGLVISFGTGTTAGAALRHPLARLDLVDVDPVVFELAGYFSTVNHDVLRDPRAHVIVNDGRNFLALTGRRYDVITLEPMPPTFAHMVNLYSREFYAMARTRLRPGGLLCQWVPFHLMSADETSAVLRTFSAVFPQSALWLHRGSGFIIGTTDQAFEVDAARIAARLDDGAVRADLASVGVSGLVPLLNLLAWGPGLLQAETARGALVTDDRPILDFPQFPFRPAPRSSLAARRVWQAHETIYGSRRREVPPVINLSPAAAAELAQVRDIFDQDTVGGAALELGHLELAEAMFRSRLATCRTDTCRAQLTYRLALAAERRGDLDDARQKLKEAERLQQGLVAVGEALRRIDGLPSR